MPEGVALTRALDALAVHGAVSGVCGTACFFSPSRCSARALRLVVPPLDAGAIGSRRSTERHAHCGFVGHASILSLIGTGHGSGIVHLNDLVLVLALTEGSDAL